jgi:catechol 2,3-dioxygenase-like lactoylglutathione lyase family enzyme
VLDHVRLPVSDRERSRRFYVEALSPLGYELIMEDDVSGVGFGKSGKPDFWIREGVPATAVHVAFAADDRTTVDAFHEKATRWAGATTTVPGFALSTIRPTSGPTPSIQTATTSKRSAIGRARKHEPSDPYSPNLPEQVFWEGG